MTATVQTSFLSSSMTANKPFSRRRVGKYEESVYQIEITDFDGEIQFLEVCAHSLSEAAEIAESICTCDIYMINVYEHYN